MALAIQQVTEDVALRLAETSRELTGSRYLAMAGGVALNCVANGKLIRKNLFEDIWIQPAAGDAGGALGAAYAAWHIGLGKKREVIPGRDSMKGAYLGTEYGPEDQVPRGVPPVRPGGTGRRHPGVFRPGPSLPVYAAGCAGS